MQIKLHLLECYCLLWFKARVRGWTLQLGLRLLVFYGSAYLHVQIKEQRVAAHLLFHVPWEGERLGLKLQFGLGSGLGLGLG